MKYIKRIINKKMYAADTGMDSGSIVDAIDSMDNNEEKQFTQSDLDKIISKRLDQAKRKWEKDFQEKMELLKTSGMTDEEKEKYEQNKLSQQLKDKEEELRIKELKLNSINKVNKAGLSTDILDFLDYSNEQSVDESLNVIKTIVDNIVSERIKKVITTNPPIPEKGEGCGTQNLDSFLKGLNSLR